MAHEGELDRATLLELFPIKLVGGFVTVDQHVGCVGCAFCLSRRHPVWGRAFEAGYHADGAFDSPEEALALLLRMRSVTEARVPVRFGHNTDSRFQWDFGAALYRQLPSMSPFIFMTRFPVPARHRSLLAGQPNLLVKVTITPPSRALDVRTDVDAILASVKGLPQENLYFLVGPVVADNVAGAAAVIDALPPGAWGDVKELTRSGIPGMSEVAAPAAGALDGLRTRAAGRGLTMTDWFGCRMRRAIGRPFYKIDDGGGYMGLVCRACPQDALCTSPREVDEGVRAAARSIGLTLGAAERQGAHTTSYRCEEPSSRGDETYLSELLDHRVLLSSVPEGSQGGSFSLVDPRVLARWERTGMLPSSDLEGRARRLALAMARGMEAPTKGRRVRRDAGGGDR